MSSYDLYELFIRCIINSVKTPKQFLKTIFDINDCTNNECIKKQNLNIQ
jgi:hypothetical protein